MNIDLIIEALEAYREIVAEDEFFGGIELHHADQALAEARKMKEPCVWTDYETSCHKTPLLIRGLHCIFCGRKVEYKEEE